MHLNPMVPNNISATFDSSNGKVVIAYNDAINADGEAIVGTVSGTTQSSYGSAVTFNSADSGLSQQYMTLPIKE